jgi:hypothetical protein
MKIKKLLAGFVLYNVISILIFCMALTIEDEKPATYYLDVLAGAYLGVGVLFVLMVCAVWSIKVIHD